MKTAVSIALLCLFGSWQSSAGAGSSRNALVVGNNAYEHARALRNPQNDAAAMAAALRKLGFEVIHRSDADLKSMRGALREFIDRLPAEPDPESVALVYFAGHGVQIDGKNYLIPVDAEMARDYEVSDETLSMNSIMEGLESAGAGLNLLILDCCRNNPFSRSWRGSRSTSSSGLAMPKAAPQGMFVAFSTSPGDVAEDGEGDHSPYTEALLRHLPSPGKPFEEVFKAVGGEVAGKTAGEQEPWFNSKFYGDFRFAEEGSVYPAPVTGPADAEVGRPWTNELGIEFLPVPGERGVLMARWETRVKDFRAFVEETGFRQNGGAHRFSVKEKPEGGYTTEWVHDSSASWASPGFNQSETHPVTCVSWNEARDFCRWLSKKEGRIYRLPRDREWSAAAGSGTFAWGDAWPPPPNAGNFWDLRAISKLPGDWNQSVIGGESYEDGAERTAPVASYSANENGFYDLAGNVWEWIEETYDPAMNPPDALRENATLLESRDAEGNPYKTIRGGSWDNFARVDFRNDVRDYDEPNRRDDDYGFRLVLEIE
jgi:formylglycine-generating enzyme required for sulfatase activity